MRPNELLAKCKYYSLLLPLKKIADVKEVLLKIKLTCGSPANQLGFQTPAF